MASLMRVSRPLSTLVLAALLAAAIGACSTVKNWTLGVFELKVAGNEPDRLQSLFVIVGSEADLKDAKSPDAAAQLVRVDRHSSYVAIGQYRPALGAPPRWEAQNVIVHNAAVTFLTREDALELVLKIDPSLLATVPDATVAVLAHYGGQDWRTEVIRTGEIQEREHPVLDVTSQTLRRRPPQP